MSMTQRYAGMLRRNAFELDKQEMPVQAECLRQAARHMEALERDSAQLKAAQAIAAEQAEDEALWCIATSIVEAHFQQELRRLTAAVEDDSALSQQKGGA